MSLEDLETYAEKKRIALVTTKKIYTLYSRIKSLLIKEKKQWTPLDGFNFVKPIKDDSFLSNAKEKPLVGVMKHKDPKLVSLKRNDLVGFKPSSEYEFIIEGERLYRVPTNSITIKYEYKGNEEEYNPSWAEGS